MLSVMILDKLGVFYDDIAKPKHGSCPEISWGDLVTRIVEDKGSRRANELFPEIGEQTFNRMMRKCFPIRLNGGNQTWYFYLTSIIEYKLCGKCGLEKSFQEYHKDKNRSSLGVSSICKHCTAIEQTGQYDKYRESHLKSQEKHAGDIKARNALYRIDRANRVVSWTEVSQIREFYNNCPEGYHVDHIIPLKGELVSGLHVLSNLQYLTAEENMRKGNRYTFE